MKKYVVVQVRQTGRRLDEGDASTRRRRGLTAVAEGEEGEEGEQVRERLVQTHFIDFHDFIWV